MKRSIETTGDGSVTLRVHHLDEPYHSTHGAIQESRYVFIQRGLEFLDLPRMNILEIGFGTGLNAFLTLMRAHDARQEIHYTGIEAYPLQIEEVGQLNYVAQLDVPDLATAFQQMHLAPWGEGISIVPGFSLLKKKQDILEFSATNEFNLIYFDAFGARVQPELWSESVFKSMFTALQSGGVLVTYAAKGSVRRTMQAVGFTVERLPGPPGKREMLRAIKP